MNYGFTDILTLLASLGLFLYGMKVITYSLMDVAVVLRLLTILKK